MINFIKAIRNKDFNLAVDLAEKYLDFIDENKDKYLDDKIYFYLQIVINKYINVYFQYKIDIKENGIDLIPSGIYNGIGISDMGIVVEQLDQLPVIGNEIEITNLNDFLLKISHRRKDDWRIKYVIDTSFIYDMYFGLNIRKKKIMFYMITLSK